MEIVLNNRVKKIPLKNFQFSSILGIFVELTVEKMF